MVSSLSGIAMEKLQVAMPNTYMPPLGDVGYQLYVSTRTWPLPDPQCATLDRSSRACVFCQPADVAHMCMSCCFACYLGSWSDASAQLLTFGQKAMRSGSFLLLTDSSVPRKKLTTAELDVLSVS